MLTHIVLVKWKPGTDRGQVERIVAGLRSLPGIIPEIRSYEVGEDIVRSSRSFDLAILGRYDDLDALRRYQQHPDHVPLRDALLALSEQMVSVDF